MIKVSSLHHDARAVYDWQLTRVEGLARTGIAEGTRQRAAMALRLSPVGQRIQRMDN